MNVKQRHALIDVLEKAIADGGFDLYRDAPRLERFLEANLHMIAVCQSRESLNSFLASAGEVEEERFHMLMALMQAFPTLVSTFFQDSLKKLVASSPKGPLGRPLRVSPVMGRDITEKIGRLYTSGVSIGTAQSRVAKQFGISKRSVQSVWRKRQQFAQQPFQDISDVLLFLNCAFKITTH